MKEKDLIDLTNKETQFVIMYLLTNNRTEAYKYIQGEDASTNYASIRAMASAYGKGKLVKQLEPVVKDMFMKSATALMEREGYKVLKPKEATEYKLHVLNVKSNANAVNATPDIAPDKVLKASEKLTKQIEAKQKEVSELNEKAKQLKEDVKELNQNKVILTNEVSKVSKEKDRITKEVKEMEAERIERGNEWKGGEGMPSDKNKPDNFNDNPGITDLANPDLSNKDAMIDELNLRYSLARNERDRIDIRKQIIDVQNMKKQEIEQEGVQKRYYLPLRACETCPSLSAILKQVE